MAMALALALAMAMAMALAMAMAMALALALALAMAMAMAMAIVDDIQTIIYNVHGNYAKGAIVNSDLTLTPCFIAKEGDLFAHGRTLQEAVQAAQSKAIEEMPVERRIDKFLQVYSDKNEKHSGREFFNWHHILTGSCEMGRNQFCKDNDIEIDAEYTPVEFLNLCKDAYKGDVIKKVLQLYER